MNVTLHHGLPGAQRRAAARLYWQAFGGKLGAVLGPDARALRHLDRVIDPGKCIAALDGDRLIGIVGLGTAQGGFAGGAPRDFVHSYGLIGALWRLPALLYVGGTSAPADTLMLDGFSVLPACRGMGVGAALLGAAVRHAETVGCAQIQLDVINTNWRARAFYARHGFALHSQRRIWPLHLLYGFDSVVRMSRKTR